MASGKTRHTKSRIDIARRCRIAGRQGPTCRGLVISPKVTAMGPETNWSADEHPTLYASFLKRLIPLAEDGSRKGGRGPVLSQSDTLHGALAALLGWLPGRGTGCMLFFAWYDADTRPLLDKVGALRARPGLAQPRFHGISCFDLFPCSLRWWPRRYRPRCPGQAPSLR